MSKPRKYSPKVEIKVGETGRWFNIDENASIDDIIRAAEAQNIDDEAIADLKQIRRELKKLGDIARHTGKIGICEDGKITGYIPLFDGWSDQRCI